MATRKARFVPSNLFTYRAEMRSPIKFIHPGFWLRLLQTHPFRLLVSIWGITAIAGLIAIAGLVNPGDINQTPQAKAPAPARVADTEAGEPHSVPLWSLSVLISSCAVGCIVVSKLLNRKPAPPRKALSPNAQLARRALQGQAALRSRRLGPAKASPKARKIKRLKPYRETDAWLLPPLSPAQQPPQAKPLPPSQLSARRLPPQAAIAKAMPKPQPAITVIPPEEIHPLDWGEESLAHAMDLRKQQPLSSLL